MNSVLKRYYNGYAFHTVSRAANDQSPFSRSVLLYCNGHNIRVVRRRGFGSKGSIIAIGRVDVSIRCTVSLSAHAKIHRTQLIARLVRSFRHRVISLISGTPALLTIFMTRMHGQFLFTLLCEGNRAFPLYRLVFQRVRRGLSIPFAFRCNLYFPSRS